MKEICRTGLKKTIHHIASVGFIYRGKNPNEIFAEIKDRGYPIKLYWDCLCPIGGNWVGENAKKDNGPLDTFKREVAEELSLEQQERGKEKIILGVGDTNRTNEALPKLIQLPSNKEKKQLNDLKTAICENCAPFGTFLTTLKKETMDEADAANKTDTFTAIVCYWTVPLSEEYWRVLKTLQKKFCNLSNESNTLITSLDEILAKGIKIMPGPTALQRFFLAMGLSQAKQLPCSGGAECSEISTALATYQDYLEHYNIIKKP